MAINLNYLDAVVEIVDAAGHKPALSAGAVNIIGNMYYDAVANALWYRDHCVECGSQLVDSVCLHCSNMDYLEYLSSIADKYNPDTGELW